MSQQVSSVQDMLAASCGRCVSAVLIINGLPGKAAPLTGAELEEGVQRRLC